MKRIVIFLFPVLLSGCVGLPQQISMINQAVSGLSLMVTGKTNTDHLLSAATERDCSLFRAIEGQPVCRRKKMRDLDQIALLGPDAVLNVDMPIAMPSEGGLAAIAAIAPAAGPGADTSGSGDVITASPAFSPAMIPTRNGSAKNIQKATASPVQDALHILPPESATVHHGAARYDASAHKGKLTPENLNYYVSLASYANAADAEQAANHAANSIDHLNGKPEVMSAFVKGRKVYRVVSGPLTQREARDLRQRARNAGYGSAWLVRTCSPKQTGETCLVASVFDQAIFDQGNFSETAFDRAIFDQIAFNQSGN
jgi:hypothetical protein